MDNIEWEIDEQGRRFRRIGNAIEYEMVIHTNGIEVPQSELSAFHERQKAADAKRKEEAERRAAEEAKKPKYSCPFSSGMNSACRREECPLYIADRCSIATIADGLGVEIEAKTTNKKQRCPFSIYSRCESCALHRNGCAIARIAAAQTKNN